jgi:GNAT superfamily N-acetyltransferase
LVEHFVQISPHQNILLQPDFQVYDQCDKQGLVRFYTARSADDQKLVGYALFFVRTHPHFRGSIQAHQDLLFIHPEKRGFGWAFLRWIDEELAKEGVQMIHQTVTTQCDYSPLLKRLGYTAAETIYTRRLF